MECDQHSDSSSFILDLRLAPSLLINALRDQNEGETMKTNITYFTLILLAALQANASKGFAQTQAGQQPATTQQQPANQQPANSQQAANTSQQPEKRVDTPVSPEELSKNGIDVQFNQDTLQLTGSIPAACSPYLTVRDSKSEEPDDDNKSRSGVKDRKEMPDKAVHVGLVVAFSASSDMKTLSSCIDAHKSDLDKTDLSTVATLGKIIPNASKDWYLGGFVNGSNKVVLGKIAAMSDGYKKVYNLLDPKLLAKHEKDHCATCNTKELEGLVGLDDMVQSTLEAEIAGEDDVIKSAKNVKDLDKARKDLETYMGFISGMTSDGSKKDALAALISGSYERLLTKADDLAHAHESDASAYADFIASTYGSEANLPGVSEDSRKEALKLKVDFSSGGSKRVDFLSAIDPNNKEVVAALKSGQSSLNREAREVNKACFIIASEKALERCNTAKMQYYSTMSNLDMIKLRYMEAQQMNSLAQYRNPMFGMQMSGFNGFNAGASGSAYGLSSNAFPSTANVNGGLYFGAANQGNALYGINSMPNTWSGGANYGGLYQQSNPFILSANAGAGANLYSGSMMNANLARSPSTINTNTSAIPINLNYSVTQQPSTQQQIALQGQAQQQGPFTPTFSFGDSTSTSSDN